MYTEPTCAVPEGRCAEQAFRLAVYEAGHALTARALGLRVISVRMLPRPPILVSDKAFGQDWDSFIETLEIRIIELFGGLLAEEFTCSSATCCSGDVARIDELTRLVAGLSEEGDHEFIWDKLENVAQKIFDQKRNQDAILPLAEFLYQRVLDGEEFVNGKDVEVELDRLVPFAPKKKWSKRLFSFGRP